MSTLRRYGPNKPPRQIRVSADDGCTLNLRVLREARDGAAPPVVFIHALAMDGNLWQGIVDALDALAGAPQGALYALDCRGHGASEASGPIEQTFTTARFAQDLANTLDALNAPRAHVVGCSMGGTVALAFTGRWPGRVVSLTVIDATAWYGDKAATNWETRAQTALTGGMQALVGFQLERWFSPDFLVRQPELAKQALEVFTANRVSAYVQTCRMLGQADERAALAAYTGPAAVVVGEQDFATPVAMSQDIVARLTGATLTVIPGTRHYTPLEAPEAVAACIHDVVRTAEKTR